MEVFPLPLVIHPRVRKTIGRVAAMSCVAVFASTGAALAACPAPSVSPAFSQFGDTNSYFVVPGGSFDGSAGGWTLNNASLSASGDGFNLGGAANPRSVTINAGGSATSPFFCVDNTMPSMRFVADEATSGSNLRVDAVVKNPWGGTWTVPVANLADGSNSGSWAPTSVITAPAIPADMTFQVALRFSVSPSSGAWGIDDVFIDPFRMS